ncbi:MAG: hypothetical protein WCT02_03790, partial [Candidatus Paceibacterota bacterium]
MSIYSYVRRHSFIASVLIVVVIIIGIMAGRTTGTKTDQTLKPTVKKVTLVPVTSFRENTDSLIVDGTVESRGQADLKSQISAPVAVLHGKIGDPVYAG